MRCVVEALVHHRSSWPVFARARQVSVSCQPCSGATAAGRRVQLIPGMGGVASRPSRVVALGIRARSSMRVAQWCIRERARGRGPSCHTSPTQQRFPAFPLQADASTTRRKHVTPCRLCAVLDTMACWHAERVRQAMANTVCVHTGGSAHGHIRWQQACASPNNVLQKTKTAVASFTILLSPTVWWVVRCSCPS
jgi:hypothetical protein